MSVRKKVARVGCLVLVIGLVIAAYSPAGKAIFALAKVALQKDVSGTESFKGDLKDRLEAMYTAAGLYHQSEDSYPKAEKWMDDLLTRLQTQNLKPGEAEKKLKRPDLENSPTEYGFAMNTAVAGKYKGDLKDPETIMFFESKSTTKNAVGDPKKDGVPGGQAITISGKFVKL